MLLFSTSLNNYVTMNNGSHSWLTTTACYVIFDNKECVIIIDNSASNDTKFVRMKLICDGNIVYSLMS